MRRIAHLSDLHFGRDRPELLQPLLDAVNALRPDLVVMSGDLTQRAREDQFRAAAAFIKAVEAPVLSVPGNHDVPLDNLIWRLFLPWRRYKQWINPDLEPQFADAEIVVIGVNTVNRFVWQQGWFRSRALRRVSAAFAGGAHRRVHIVVAHHPLEHPDGEPKSLMRGAARGLRSLSDNGTDLVLSGHLHSWRAELFANVAGLASALQVHAGTSLSDRMRGEVNDFNLLEVERSKIIVHRYGFADGADSFVLAASVTFSAGPEGWTRSDVRSVQATAASPEPI